jgi:hypothetical protein
MHEPDVVPLQQRYCSVQYSAWSVSVLKYNNEDVIDEERTSLTVLRSNACAICCAPSAPISFQQRFSVMSVCIET